MSLVALWIFRIFDFYVMISVDDDQLKNFLRSRFATFPGNQRVCTGFPLTFVIEFVENGVQHLSEMCQEGSILYEGRNFSSYTKCLRIEEDQLNISPEDYPYYMKNGIEHTRIQEGYGVIYLHNRYSFWRYLRFDSSEMHLAITWTQFKSRNWPPISCG